MSFKNYFKAGFYYIFLKFEFHFGVTLVSFWCHFGVIFWFLICKMRWKSGRLAMWWWVEATWWDIRDVCDVADEFMNRRWGAKKLCWANCILLFVCCGPSLIHLLIWILVELLQQLQLQLSPTPTCGITAATTPTPTTTYYGIFGDDAHCACHATLEMEFQTASIRIDAGELPWKWQQECRVIDISWLHVVAHFIHVATLHGSGSKLNRL